MEDNLTKTGEELPEIAIKTEEKRDEKGLFLEGTAPGPGRPKGSVSVITRLKQMFEENPDDFEAFVKAYKTNEDNQKHIVEMIDGKPFQKSDITSGGKELPQPLLFALKKKDE